MARYYTNFTEEPFGSIEPFSKNWEQVTNPPGRTNRIEYAAPGSKLTTVAGGSNGASLVGFKPTKNYNYSNTIESLVEFSVNASVQVPGSYGIVNHKYNGTQGLSLAFMPAASVKSLILYDDKNGRTVAFANYNWSNGTKYWVRYRQENTQHYVKIWPSGSAEPAGWTFTATYDIGAISGNTWTGIGTYSANATIDYYQFALGTNGDTAVAKSQNPNYYNGYKYRKLITIDKTKVSAFTGYYRILLNHTDADLKSVANGGKVELKPLIDIRFEDANGVQLPHEMVNYNPATGSIEAWVRLGYDTTSTSVSTTVDTTFYMYFGKTLTADSVRGIRMGYASGFVTFERNWDRAGNVENQGEISPFISSMTDPSGNSIVQPNNTMITGREDGVLTSGYIMYTAQNAQSRFGVAAGWNDHLVLVYWNGSNWVQDNNGDQKVFTPVASDFIVASLSWGQTPASGRSMNYVSALRAGEEKTWQTWSDLWSDDINDVGNASRAVFHFDETPASTLWVVNVESSDRFSLGMSGSGTPTSTTGKVGRAISFNGSGQKLRGKSDVIWSALGHGYLSVWFKPSNLAHNGAIFARRTNTSSSDQLAVFNLNGAIRLDNGTFRWSTGYTLPAANQWYHLVWIANGTQHKLYVNGVLRATRDTSDTFNGTTGYNRVQFGASQTDAGTDGNWFNGAIDEFVLSTDNKADGFHVTTYNNQNSPSTFYSSGALELAVQNAVNNTTSTSPVIVEHKTLSSNSAVHGQTVNSITVTQLHNIAVDGSIIDWTKLGVKFGIYKQDFRDAGNISSAELAEKILLRQRFGESGQFETTAVDEPGVYKPQYQQPGKF